MSKFYNTLAAIKKLKNLAPFHVRKRLEESLVLSLIDYKDIVPDTETSTCPTCRGKFVYNHSADMSDALKPGWLPISYR